MSASINTSVESNEYKYEGLTPLIQHRNRPKFITPIVLIIINSSVEGNNSP